MSKFFSRVLLVVALAAIGACSKRSPVGPSPEPIPGYVQVLNIEVRIADGSGLGTNLPEGVAPLDTNLRLNVFLHSPENGRRVSIIYRVYSAEGAVLFERQKPDSVLWGPGKSTSFVVFLLRVPGSYRAFVEVHDSDVVETKEAKFEAR